MSTMVTRLVAAMNSRGALRVAALFAEDYRSELYKPPDPPDQSSP